MQDYDPSYTAGCNLITDSLNCSNLNRPNIFGCRNRQLSDIM